MGVGGDELRLADARGRVDDCVGGREAVIEAGVGGCERDGFVERNNAAMEGLRDEAVGDGAAALPGEVTVDLVEDERGYDHRSFALKIVAERGGLRIFRQILEPPGGIDQIGFRTAPSAHEARLSISSLWRCREAP